MARPTDRTRSQIDQRRPGSGEPWPYADILAWCHANIAKGAWEQHRTSTSSGGTSGVRWHFLHQADAVAFNERGLNGAATPEVELQRDLEPVDGA